MSLSLISSVRLTIVAPVALVTDTLMRGWRVDTIKTRGRRVDTIKPGDGEWTPYRQGVRGIPSNSEVVRLADATKTSDVVLDQVVLS
jgi:hypothetical protein